MHFVQEKAENGVLSHKFWLNNLADLENRLIFAATKRKTSRGRAVGSSSGS